MHLKDNELFFSHIISLKIPGGSGLSFFKYSWLLARKHRTWKRLQPNPATKEDWAAVVNDINWMEKLTSTVKAVSHKIARKFIKTDFVGCYECLQTLMEQGGKKYSDGPRRHQISSCGNICLINIVPSFTESVYFQSNGPWTNGRLTSG